MISPEEHERNIKTYSSLVEWFAGGGKEVVFQLGGFSKSEHRRMEEVARQEGKTKAALVREAVEKEAKKDGQFTSHDFKKIVEKDAPLNLSPDVIALMGEVTRDARIFEVPSNVFRSIIDTCQEHFRHAMFEAARQVKGEGVEKCLRRLFKLVDRENAAGRNAVIPDEIAREAEEPFRLVIEEMKRTPFPERLPFESCLFLDSDPSLARLMSKGIDRAFLSGILISTKISFFVNSIIEPPYTDYRPIPTWLGSSWVNADHESPWVVDSLVRLVNEHRRIVELRPRGLSEKMLEKKLKKNGVRIPGPVPPPFYIVNLTAEYIKQNKKSIFPPRRRVWSHQWDVRGHEAVRVMRGPLPIDGKLERKLRRRRYKIFTVGEVDPDAWRLLGQRRIEPKKATEWMAILAWWRDSFVKGPKDKPYVPAAHRVPGKSQSKSKSQSKVQERIKADGVANLHSG